MRKQHEALKANEELRQHVDEPMSTMQGSLSDVQSTIAQLTLQIAKLAKEKDKVQLEEDPSVIGGERKTPDPTGKVWGSVIGSGFGIPAQLSTQMHQFNPKGIGIEQRTPNLGVRGVGSVLGLGITNHTQFTPRLNQFTPNDNLLFPSPFQSHITQHPYHTNSPYIAAFRAPGNSSDQTNMENSMAEDPVSASTPTVPVFGQPFLSPSPAGFIYGSTAPSPAPLPPPFQFGGQQNPATPPNPSPFQASNSLDFSAGGSFLLGSGGGDKSARKKVRVGRSRNWKK